jgi:hypothetical protein
MSVIPKMRIGFLLYFCLIGSSVYVFICTVKALYLPVCFSFHMFLILYFIFIYLFIVIPTDLRTFHKSGSWSDLRFHDLSNWKHLRAFLTVVVVWDVTPCSSVGRHRRFRGTCLCVNDRNAFTSQKTVIGGRSGWMRELTRANTFHPLKVTEHGNPPIHCQRRLIRRDL